MNAWLSHEPAPSVPSPTSPAAVTSASVEIGAACWPSTEGGWPSCRRDDEGGQENTWQPKGAKKSMAWLGPLTLFVAAALEGQHAA